MRLSRAGRLDNEYEYDGVPDYEVSDFEMADNSDQFDFIENQFYPEDGLFYSEMDESNGEFTDLFSEYDTNGSDEETHIQMDFLQ